MATHGLSFTVATHILRLTLATQTFTQPYSEHTRTPTQPDCAHTQTLTEPALWALLEDAVALRKKLDDVAPATAMADPRRLAPTGPVPDGRSVAPAFASLAEPRGTLRLPTIPSATSSRAGAGADGQASRPRHARNRSMGAADTAALVGVAEGSPPARLGDALPRPDGRARGHHPTAPAAVSVSSFRSESSISRSAATIH